MDFASVLQIAKFVPSSPQSATNFAIRTLACAARGKTSAFASGDSNLAPRRAFHRAAAVVLAAVLCAPAAGLVQASSPGKPQPGSSMKPAIAYKPLAFAEVPGWDQDDHAAAFKAFLKSCERVVATARERTAADKAPPPPAALVAACTAASRACGARRQGRREGVLRAEFHGQRRRPQRSARPADRLLRAAAAGLAHAARRFPDRRSTSARPTS